MHNAYTQESNTPRSKPQIFFQFVAINIRHYCESGVFPKISQLSAPCVTEIVERFHPKITRIHLINAKAVWINPRVNFVSL